MGIYREPCSSLRKKQGFYLPSSLSMYITYRAIYILIYLHIQIATPPTHTFGFRSGFYIEKLVHIPTPTLHSCMLSMYISWDVYRPEPGDLNQFSDSPYPDEAFTNVTKIFEHSTVFLQHTAALLLKEVEMWSTALEYRSFFNKKAFRVLPV